MSRRLLIILASLIILGVATGIGFKLFHSKPVVIENGFNHLTLTLPGLEGNTLPQVYTCEGDNSSPPLTWGGVPERSKSLVLVMNDISEKANNYTHWLMWNIAAKDGSVRMGNVPLGASTGTGSGGRVGYMGPCPKDGAHQYLFKLLALDTTLNLPLSTTVSELEAAISGHVIETAEITVNYE